MAKTYTQEQLDSMTESQISQIVHDCAQEVDIISLDRPVNSQIRRIMREQGLKPGLMVRRMHDGVTEVEWMLKKMLGERLAHGRPWI